MLRGDGGVQVPKQTLYTDWGILSFKVCPPQHEYNL